MHKLVSGAAIGLALALCTTAAAAAATYTDDFLDTGASWNANDNLPPQYYFYFDGASASQTYAGTGLDSAGSIDLEMQFQRFSLIDTITFTFSLNGTDIGDWTLSPLVPAEVADLSFNFASIAANAGQSFTLGLRVTDGVCFGCGSILVESDAPSSFTLSDSVVPEPATWALMILGFGAAGGMLRRRTVLA